MARSNPVWSLVGCAAVALALTACASPAEVTADRAATVNELTRLSDAWDRAIVGKNRQAIADNMADDFRQIDSDGDFEAKAGFVDGLMSSQLQLDPYRVEEFEVRLYGDAALLTGRIRITGRYDGKPFVSHFRYTDTYVRRDGRWKVVSVQQTRLKP